MIKKVVTKLYLQRTVMTVRICPAGSLGIKSTFI